MTKALFDGLWRPGSRAVVLRPKGRALHRIEQRATSWRALIAVPLLAVGCSASPASAPPADAPAASAPPTPIVSAAPASAQRQAPAPVERRHDLAADERRGGHTLERHVGRSDEQLRERLRVEPNISAASTYTDRDTAERVVADAMDESAAELMAWQMRVGRRPNLVLDRDEPSPIGRSLRRGQRQPTDCAHAIVVLRWDERARHEFVLTSYPECRR